LKGELEMLRQFLQDESGATAIEYGLIAALISVALITGARSIGEGIDNQFSVAATEVSKAGTEYLDK